MILATCLHAPTTSMLQEDSALTTDGSRIVLDEGHAFVELGSSASEYVVGQTFGVRIRMGVERGFAQSNLIQLFRTKLDLPVQLQADWLAGDASMRALPSKRPAEAAWPRFALAGELLGARPIEDRELQGQTFLVYEFERQFKLDEPQTLSLSPVEMRYAFATEFEDSFLTGRSPSNRIDALVRSSPLELEIRPLPLDNPPFGFSGAIGSFAISASLEDHGEGASRVIAWTLKITGEGNHQEIADPSIAQFSAFNSLGSLSEPAAGPGAARVIRYDLRPKDAMPGAVPAYSFIYFDVEGGKFQTIMTEALPILQPETGASGAATKIRPPGKAGKNQPAESTSSAVADRLPLIGGIFAIAVLIFWMLRGRRRAAAAEQQGPRVRANMAALSREAAGAFREAQAADGSALLAAYSDFLASCLDTQGAELQAEGLSARLRPSGVPEPLALRAEAALASLLAARYGRGECGQAGQAAPEIVQELALHWSSVAD